MTELLDAQRKVKKHILVGVFIEAAILLLALSSFYTFWKSEDNMVFIAFSIITLCGIYVVKEIFESLKLLKNIKIILNTVKRTSLLKEEALQLRDDGKYKQADEIEKSIIDICENAFKEPT